MRSRSRRSDLTWLLFAAVLPGAAPAQPFTISTYAGGPLGTTHLAATKAILGTPVGVAVDAAGNVYFASLDSVFEVNAAGTLVRIGGDLHRGFRGDGGPALEAQLFADQARAYWPIGIAIDNAGNVFVADRGNQRIRKISTAGTMSTVAQVDSVVGLAVDGAGNIYFTGDCSLQRMAPSGTVALLAGDGYCAEADGGLPGTAAALDWTSGLAIDGAGNLFFAERYRVRRLDPAGNLTVVAGNGTAGESGDGGPATDAQLSAGAIALDAAGNLYINDYEGRAVRKVTADGVIATAAGSTVAYGVAVDGAGNLYIAEGFQIRMLAPDGSMRVVAGGGDGGDGGAAADAQFNFVPWGGSVAGDAAGGFYIADAGNQRVRKVSADGTVSTVVDMGGILGFGGDGGPAIDAILSYPSAVAVSGAGSLYIADTYNVRVREVNASGIISTLGGAVGPVQAVALDGSGNVYAAAGCLNKVVRIAPDGSVSVVAGSGGGGYTGDGGLARNAQIGCPWGLALDGAGNLYLGDIANNVVRKVTPAGIITTVAGSGVAGSSGDGGPAVSARLNAPVALAADAFGNLFIADSYNNRIRMVSADGTISTVAGNGTTGYSGDGGPATEAQFGSLSALWIDPAGNLYAADQYYNVIRVMKPARQ